MSKFSFLSQQRIRRSAEFDVILKTGKRSALSCFALCVKQSEHEKNRLGIMFGKRHCPRAVDRNRLKRFVRERFRLHQHAFHHLDIVFLLRSPAKNLTDQEQSACIDTLFTKYIAQ